MAAPFKVKAVYEYSSAHDDDLKFRIGQIITVTDSEDPDWYGGEYLDDAGTKQEGIFPRNFVEKFEPTAPPRPTRTRTKKEPEQAPAAEEPLQEQIPEPEPGDADVAQSNVAVASAPVPEPEAPMPKQAEPMRIASPPPPVSKPAEVPAMTSPPKPAPAQQKPGGPPPVSQKPSGNSFKDRIAAFNKPAAAPITPFKPSGLGSGSSGFIKKPFVAPPPSRNAFIPPPSQAPVNKVYRREEDPEIREREAENQENAEKAGLAPAAAGNGGDDDEPKPLSLKERMALLQKQQQEQAQRHAEAAAKKEKPKRPAKKRTESHETAEEVGGAAEGFTQPSLERRDTEETGGRTSLEQEPPRMPPPRRRSTQVSNVPDDGNEADMSGAGDTEGLETERDDSDAYQRPPPVARVPTSGTTGPVPQEAEEEGEEEGIDDDEDPEARRKEELRARMAKMSGGMGMYGMFGAMPMPGPSAPAKKKRSSTVRSTESAEGGAAQGTPAPPVPAMAALPGMGRGSEDRLAAPEGSYDRPPTAPSRPGTAGEEADDESTIAAPGPPPAVPSRDRAEPPPVPGGRPAPPPVPADSRPPPPPPSDVKSDTAGSESDDEDSETAQPTPLGEALHGSRPPPLPPVASPPPMIPASPRQGGSKRTSYMGDDIPQVFPTSPPQAPSSRRNSRVPPPIPGSVPAPPLMQSRPPPPPPPGSLSRASTSDSRPVPHPPPQAGVDEEEEAEGEVTEYEGDYDTDIASSAPHKDALKSHQRNSSVEDPSTPVRSPVVDAPAPPSMPPPMPLASIPMAGPPPVPSHPPPPPTDNRRSSEVPRGPPPPPPPQDNRKSLDAKRKSMDVPRGAPPPPPPAPTMPTPGYGDDYDPFNYQAPAYVRGQSPAPPRVEEPMYPEEARLSPYGSPPLGRAPPPPAAASASGSRPLPRQSLDVGRQQVLSRRSVDVSRPSTESGFMANDIDLATQTGWWQQPNTLPPILQGRKDIYFETGGDSTTKHGNQSIVTRDIYVLFQDYSKTIITVAFNPNNPSDVQLDQRHEPPPRALRQDELEDSYERFGRAISEAVRGKKETVVGDGSPHALVHELLGPFPGALKPVGSRAYGALVYSNLANASTSQNDEIRPGDIVSIRNARFQGKHGPMHAKYSAEVGKPDHVGVVAEWDGTKKKVRAWEQGRESKKVKMESFKLDDLRSGEVKIWRVMPRSWVGWEDAN